MRKSVKRSLKAWLVLLGVGGVVSASTTEQVKDILRSAQGGFTVDLTGLPVGGRVAEVAVGRGVSGSGVGGVIFGAAPTNVVRVSAQRKNRLGDANRAMIFDGECAGDAANCSGGDDDLYNPGQGNLLIVSQDNNADDPNDNHGGGHIDFDFSSFGPGTVSATSVEVFDVSHRGAAVYLYADGELVKEVPVSSGDTGEKTTVALSTPGVDLVRVAVADSFAVDNLVFEVSD